MSKSEAPKQVAQLPGVSRTIGWGFLDTAFLNQSAMSAQARAIATLEEKGRALPQEEIRTPWESQRERE